MATYDKFTLRGCWKIVAITNRCGGDEAEINWIKPGVKRFIEKIRGGVNNTKIKNDLDIIQEE